MIVTVTIDHRENPVKNDGPHRLFALSKQTIQSILALAGKQAVPVEEFVWLDGSRGRFMEGGALAFLERHLFRYSRSVYQKKSEQIHLKSCRDAREELLEAVRTMRRLVRTENYRYGDFAVVVGDLDTYKNYAPAVFEQAEIPYFLDQKHSVLLNPFVEFLRAAMELAVDNYSYESVFRYLRSGMSDLGREDTDVLENYVLALGIRGRKQWSEPWVRNYQGMPKEELGEMNRLREAVLGEVDEFVEAQKKRGATVEERTRALYGLAVRMRSQEKLAAYEREFEEKGQLAYVKEYRQIYEIIMKLLDKLVVILGAEPIRLVHYQQLLEAGFADASVGVIPPSASQVLIGDMERTRLKDIKVLFCLGVNDGLIPRVKECPGIFSERDRSFLEEQKLILSPPPGREIYIQKFYLYLNLTKPSKQLYLSYSRANAKGEALLPSYLVGELKKLFPALETGEADSRGSAAEYPKEGLKLLLPGLRDATLREENPNWRELFAWYLRQEEFREEMVRLLEAAFYENPQDNIGKSVARALYGGVLSNSATRLERFAACAFAHFLQYGLQISERMRYEFRAMDMGKIMHEALERFSMRLRRERLTYETLTDEGRDELMDACVDEIIHDYGNTILHSSERNAYIIERVKRIMRRTVWALQEQLKCGSFTPGGFEVSFAMEDELDAINIALDEDAKLKLRGRIDRMDRCESADKIYIKVIDYKSGNTAFDLVALYHGLQLQLAVYQNAALELEQRRRPDKTVEPAGIFYYNIKDPILAVDGDVKWEEMKQKLLTELCMNGLARKEPEVLRLLDHTLGPEKKKSQVIPVSVSAKGELTKSSSAAGMEQFQIIRDYVNWKVRELGQRILSGEADAAPYELGRKDACEWCAYKGICGFDERVCGYEHRRLAQYSDEFLWQIMKGEVQDEDKLDR